MDQTLRQRLEADMKTAMRAGDTGTRDAVRYILAAVKNAEIERRGPLGPADEQAVVRRLGKQLADAVEQYRAAGRDELADREQSQLDVLQRYQQQELSDEDLRAIVDGVIDDLGAAGPKDMGKVMPALMERVAGRADGRRISSAARDALARRG